MKTIKLNQPKTLSKKIVAIKVMAFLAWIMYIGIALANDIMIEAFLISIALVIVSYTLFSRKPPNKNGISTPKNNSHTVPEKLPGQHYLSVFFYSAQEAQ